MFLPDGSRTRNVLDSTYNSLHNRDSLVARAIPCRDDTFNAVNASGPQSSTRFLHDRDRQSQPSCASCIAACAHIQFKGKLTLHSEDVTLTFRCGCGFLMPYKGGSCHGNLVSTTARLYDGPRMKDLVNFCLVPII